MNWPLAGNANRIRMVMRKDAEFYIGWKKLNADVSTDADLHRFIEVQYAERQREALLLTRAIAGDEESVNVVLAQNLCVGSASLETCLRNLMREIHPLVEGLFAFGHADLYSKIIDTLGPLVWDNAGHARDWPLAWCLVDLLPFPAPKERSHEWLYTHLESIRAWLDENWTRLEWDETIRKYCLTGQAAGAPPW